MDAVSFARPQRLGGVQPALQIESQRSGRHRSGFWNASHWRVPREQNDPGLPALALQDREPWMCGRCARNPDANIKALGDGDWKTPSRNWMDPDPVNRDELAPKRAEIEMIGAHGRAVDDAQQNRRARLDLDHLRVGK